MPNLYPYQEETVKFGIENKYCIYALDMGLGKSLVSLETAFRLGKKALVICPAYLKLKWKAEVHKFYPDKVVSLFNSAKDIYKVWDTDVCILPLSLLEHGEVLFEWAQIVIADEATAFKELKTKRTIDFHRMIYENSVERCLLLTGTPILNRVYEFYSLLAICNYSPDIEESAFLQKFPDYVTFANYFSYVEENLITRTTKKGKRKKVMVRQWEGVRNTEELAKWIKPFYIRYEADKILDLPPEIEVKVPASMDNNPELMEDFMSFVNENESANSRLKKESAIKKVPFTVEYVKGLHVEGVEQVVVYSDHVDSAKLIAKALGVEPITGETPMWKRRELAENFMAGKSKNIVATIKSFSTGEDLMAANNMVFNDVPWIPGDLAQAKARIRRIGQKRRCIYHYILGTLQDEAILSALDRKTKTINEVIK